MMQRIKILYLIDKLEVGGTQRHLAQLLGGIDREMFEPRVCCLQRLGPIADEIVARNIPVWCLGLRRIYGIRAYMAQRRLVSVINREGIDVIHSYLFSANLFGTLAGRRVGARVIASKRDMGFETSILQKRASRWVNAHADIVTANSQAVARHILAEGGITGDKVKVIYNGISDDAFRMTEQSVAENLLAKHPTWRKGRPTAGIVANLKPVKNHAGFLSAAKMVLGKMPEAQFLIVGDGPLRKELESEAASLGISDRTTFFGEAANPRDLLPAMDAFVLCSLHEGFPNAVLEAMAAGKAVAATANGGCPEIIRHGRNGFLVSPTDTESLAEYVVRLLDSRALRETLGKAARETVAARFTLERMVDEFEQLYADILTPVGGVRREERSATLAMCW
jgi:glycosyltransferase involved in cell wall biosynthesis